MAGWQVWAEWVRQAGRHAGSFLAWDKSQLRTPTLAKPPAVLASFLSSGNENATIKEIVKKTCSKTLKKAQAKLRLGLFYLFLYLFTFTYSSGCSYSKTFTL
jgi:hypothetical protein